MLYVTNERNSEKMNMTVGLEVIYMVDLCYAHLLSVNLYTDHSGASKP